VSYDQEKFQVEFNVQDYKPEVRLRESIQGGYRIMESVLYAQYIVATCPRHGQILRLQRH
jgi:hypothetical protein